VATTMVPWELRRDRGRGSIAPVASTEAERERKLHLCLNRGFADNKTYVYCKFCDSTRGQVLL
jgi:hypothetical protein